MKENSIGETNLENFKLLILDCKEHRKLYNESFVSEDDIEIMAHILSDYKRVLKENEKLKKQNYDLLRKLKNRVKEVRKLEKYSMYKKEFSTLNKKVNELQKENEELKDRWDKDTHKLQNDLDIANAEKIEIQKENEELNKIKSLIEILKVNTMEDEKYIVISKGSFFDGSYKFLLDDYISKQKIKDILNEINKEYIKQEKIFNKHFEKENRDIQDYYIQKEATNIMQELSWIEGKLQDLL